MKKNHKPTGIFFYMALDYLKVAMIFSAVTIPFNIILALVLLRSGVKVNTPTIQNISKIISTGFMIALIGCFIYVTNRRLKQYLNALNRALHQLPNVGQQTEIDYVGPREFQEIFNSFNEISQQLYESHLTQTQLSESKQRMLSDISHDLKTPVTTISGYSKALLDDMISQQEQRHYLEMIYKKSLHLSELVDLFYEYSRLEHPDFQLQLQNGNFCTFLQYHLAQRCMDLEEGGFLLEAEIPEEPIMISFDRMQMIRAIDNLLNNTVKHNAPNTVIMISLHQQENQAVLLISDNGCGIPQKLRDTLFEPFTTADSSRNHSKGSGLGLSITKKIVERHGGQIKLLPPGEMWQTQFEICFPIVCFDKV